MAKKTHRNHRLKYFRPEADLKVYIGTIKVYQQIGTMKVAHTRTCAGCGAVQWIASVEGIDLAPLRRHCHPKVRRLLPAHLCVSCTQETHDESVCLDKLARKTTAVKT